MSSRQLIRMRGIVKRFYIGQPNELEILHGIDLDVKEGEFVSIVGASGSGKSTLMNMIGVLDRPTEGTYWLDGTDVQDAQDDELSQIRNRKIGFVFQNFNLISRTNARKNVELPMMYAGIPQKKRTQRAEELLDLVGMADRMDHQPNELSGGQKRRVAIAGVMAMNPKVLILDEPASGLDPKGREQILGLIREYHEQMKNTVLLVSHSMEDIAKNVSKILVMNESKLFCYDDTVKVFHRSEELVSMGLAVPQITRVINRLKAMGIDIKDDVYTVGYAKKVILEMLEQKKNK